jgi:hypothetical protein
MLLEKRYNNTALLLLGGFLMPEQTNDYDLPL